MRLVAYCRVSTNEQGESGLGLDAQELAIRDAVDRRGDILVEVIREVASGGKQDRAGLERAVGMCGTEADGIIVAKLDRLSRSVSHFASLMGQSRKQGWVLIALDLGVDTSTPAGELVANVIAAVAQWERSVISDRAKATWAARRQRGDLGLRPEQRTGAATVARILELRAEGLTMRRIVDVLNEEGHRTGQGGQWRAGTVGYLIKKHEAKEAA